MLFLKSKKLQILIVLFLVVLPLLVGYKIQNLKYALNYFSSICVFFTPYFLINNVRFRKVFWGLFSFVLLAWSSTETLLLLQEHTELNYLALKIFYESNPRELLEYFTSIVPIWATYLAIVIIISLVKLLQTPKHALDNSCFKWKYFICALIIMIYFSTIHSIADVFGIFKNEYLAQNHLNKYYNKLTNRKLILNDFFLKNKFYYKKPAEKNTYVVIIGESTSRHHLGLYHYFRNTNPQLSQRNDINIYTDVISTNTSTVECLGKCLTVGGSRFERDLSYANIIDIANKMGIKTYWISNQNKDALFYNSITLATKNVGVSNFAQSPTGTSFDENIFAHLKNALNDTASNKLIIIQLIGTHFEYNKRYPAKYNVFKTNDALKHRFPYADSDKKLQKINEYDNAVLYNDYITNKIFNDLKCRKSTENIGAIYFADHADEVYDIRDFIGHTPQSNSAFLHEIPFITWNISQNNNIGRAFQMNNFANSILDWMHISSNTFDSTKSIFSNGYKPEVRFLGNGQKYYRTKP